MMMEDVAALYGDVAALEEYVAALYVDGGCSCSL